MSQVITCPNCDKKLALKDELKGRALICPQCKNRFTAPTDESGSVAEGLDTTIDEASSAGGSDMAFLDSLAASPGPAATKAATKASAPARPAASKGAAPATAQIAARAAASKAKKKNDQMLLIYIGGGIAAAVLVIILIVVGMSSSGSGGGKKKDENPRFGLTESQRKRLFKDLFHAVDENGVCKECRDEWRRLGREKGLSDPQISDVLKEGMDHGWEQPAIPATTDQKQKTNRREWIRVTTETHREPIMSQ